MKPLSTARTAGRSDWAERRFRRQPFILLSFSSSEKPQKRRKRSHTNVSNTLAARPSTPPAQTPQRSFRGTAAGTHATPAPNRAHSGLHGETGGVSGGGAITTLGAFCTVRKPCAAGYQNGVLCRFRILVEGNLEERREPAEQRCAHCASLSRGVAAPLGCVIFSVSVEIAACMPCAQGFPHVWGRGVSLPSVRFTCC